MADIATITKRAHDTGFAKGSVAAVNAILAYMGKHGPLAADQLLKAWDGGHIAPVAGAVQHPQAHTTEDIQGLQAALSGSATPSYSHPVGEPPSGTFVRVPPAILLAPPKISREQARGSGYTGDACTACQSMQVKRNGSCLVCESCGSTTGCS